jgi:cytochrome b561
MSIWEQLQPWWPHLTIGSAVLTLALILASAVALPRILADLPPDVRTQRPPTPTGARRWIANLVGGALIVLGILMLVLPGQGLLSILAGVAIADVPGKRRVLLWSLGQPRVRQAVNALRARRGVEPIR